MTNRQTKVTAKTNLRPLFIIYCTARMQTHTKKKCLHPHVHMYQRHQVFSRKQKQGAVGLAQACVLACSSTVPLFYLSQFLRPAWEHLFVSSSPGPKIDQRNPSPVCRLYECVLWSAECARIQAACMAPLGIAAWQHHPARQWVVFGFWFLVMPPHS